MLICKQNGKVILKRRVMIREGTNHVHIFSGEVLSSVSVMNAEPFIVSSL